VPRTTLQLEDEAIALARAHAVRHRITLGEAVSTLVKQGATRPVVTIERNGLRVVRLDQPSPTVTAATVDRLLDELP
jgi:hypothetical protein